MKSHAQARRQLGHRASLRPHQEEVLSAHLSQCSRCRQVAEEYGRQDHFMRTLDVPAAAGLRERILADLANDGKHHRRAPRLLALPMLVPTLVILLAVCAIGYSHFGQSGHGYLTPRAGPLVNVTVFGPQQGAHAGASAFDSARKSSTRSTGHGPAARIDVSRTAYGLQLRLIMYLASRNYAPNALLPVAITVRNVSHHAVSIDGGGGLCPVGEPTIQALNSTGTVRYPPPLPREPIVACARFGARPIEPGGVLVRHLLVVLHGSAIRAMVQFPQTTRSLTTPIAQIPIGAEHPPEIRLVIRPRMHVTFTHLDPVGGPVYVSQIEICSGRSNYSDPTEIASRQTYRDDPFWVQLLGVTLHPACAHPERWAIIAGQIGHPTVSMDLGGTRGK